MGGDRPLGCWAGGTEAAVVGLGAGDDVLDVCFLDALQPRPRVGPVDAALGLDDAGFD